MIQLSWSVLLVVVFRALHHQQVSDIKPAIEGALAIMCIN